MLLAIFFVLMLPRKIQHKLNQTDQHPHRVHDKRCRPNQIENRCSACLGSQVVGNILLVNPYEGTVVTNCKVDLQKHRFRFKA